MTCMAELGRATKDLQSPAFLQAGGGRKKQVGRTGMGTRKRLSATRYFNHASNSATSGQKTDHNSSFGLKMQGSVKINTLG